MYAIIRPASGIQLALHWLGIDCKSHFILDNNQMLAVELGLARRLDSMQR